MSGLNPFRHSRKPVPETTFPTSPRVNHHHHHHDDGSGSAFESTGNYTPAKHHGLDGVGENGDGTGEVGLGFPGRRSPRTKTVRIASPPARSISFSSHEEDSSSPEEQRHPIELRNPSTHRGSPPPRQNVTDEEDEEDEDPFNPDNSGSEDDRNSDMDRGSAAVRDQENTRQRSLSGITWGSHGYNDNSSDSSLGPGGGNGSSNGGKRSTMDVDAFKRMLLTGDPGSAPAAPPVTPSQVMPVPISGNIGNSETGLRMNYPAAEPQSFPTDPSARRLSADISIHEKKGAKPPPPKSRRGKAIGNSPGNSPSSFPHPSVEAPSPPQRGTSNHKPLPSIPTNLPHAIPDKRAAALPETSPKPAAAHHKRPPTPPLARRHSQMRKNDSPSISRSNSKRLSHPPANQAINSPRSSSSGLSPKHPPPPPSRRVDRTSIVFSPPDQSSSSSTSSQLGFTLSPESLSGVQKSETDQASDKSSLPRSESSSTISAKRQSQLSLPQPQPQPYLPSSSNVPPRPPPPRRKGTVKSSNLPDPVSQMQKKPPFDQANEVSARDPARSNASDILADLSRLQKELDELRGQQ